MRAPANGASPARRERVERMDRLAGRLATVGAAIGILAGTVDIAIGPSIRGWIGNKLDPTPLGLLTVILSAVALAGAVRWQRFGGRDGGRSGGRSGGRDGDRRLATILAFLLPAGICFTTIGRLWYAPGALLLAAASLVAGASSRDDLLRALSRRHWLAGLEALLGGYYLFLGGDALPKGVGMLGILGALSIWTALIATRQSPRFRRALVVAGALPFAVATWWSVVTPLIALLALLVGWTAISAGGADPRAARDPGGADLSSPTPAAL